MPSVFSSMHWAVAGALAAVLTVRLAAASSPSDGAFQPAPDMSFARYAGAATLLDDGAVVLYGPSHDGDRYDPVGERWIETALIPNARFNAHFFALPDGSALLMGGDVADARTVRYDTPTMRWTWDAAMSHGRRYEQAVALADGRLLVAGGYGPDGRPTASAEVYDPRTGRFTVTGAMPRPRAGGVAELLPDGRVLVAGGVDASGLGDPCAVVYAPASGSFSTAACFHNTINGVFVPASARLADGRVLVRGGYSYVGGGQRVSDAAEVYDPVTRQWSARIASPRAECTLTSLADGRVLIAGGSDDWGRPLSDTELFDPTLDALRPGPSMVTPRYGHTATRLAGNRVLLAGGQSGGGEWTASAEVYVGDAVFADGFQH